MMFEKIQIINIEWMDILHINSYLFGTLFNMFYWVVSLQIFLEFSSDFLGDSWSHLTMIIFGWVRKTTTNYSLILVTYSVQTMTFGSGPSNGSWGQRYLRSSASTASLGCLIKDEGPPWAPFAGSGGIDYVHMGVSKNRGTPKSSISIRFSIIDRPFWDTGNTHILYVVMYKCIFSTSFWVLEKNILKATLKYSYTDGDTTFIRPELLGRGINFWGTISTLHGWNDGSFGGHRL